MNRINERFVDLVGSNKMQKISSETGNYIKDGVKESSFLDEIIPLKTLTKEQIDRHPDHDEPVKIENIEEDATATALNFRSEFEEKYIEGSKYIIPFYKIETQTLKKSIYELMTYDYPITKVIEKNMIKYMANVKDEQFINACDAIISHMETLGNQSEMDYPGTFSRDVIAQGKNMLSAYKMPVVGTILMGEQNWNIWEASLPEDVGDNIATDMVKTGYGSDTIANTRVVVTNKKDLVAPNEVYFFAPPDYLGRNYLLQDIQFQVKKEKDILEMVAFSANGAGIGNLRGVVKINTADTLIVS